MNQLQKSLQLNALFSGLSGILLVAAHNRVAGLFDTPNSSVFQVIGAALIYFSLTIVFEIKHQNLLRVLIIIVQDSLWVIGSVILLIFQPFDISMTGNGVIAAIALIVLLMAISQTNALAQTDSIANKGIKQLRFERTVKATKASVWKVISDVANYHEVAPNVDDVKIISGEGKGMVRSCSHGKDSWTETCSLWEEEKEYAFEVNTDAPDYPYPFKYLKGNWKVEAIDNSQTRVIMLFEFEYKRKFQNWLLHPILKGKFGKTAEKLLDNWQNQIEKNVTTISIMQVKHIRLFILFIFCILNLTGCEDDIALEENLDYQTIVDLELPFKSTWFVVWGGRTIEKNYHASLTDQRFAIDVVQIENGSTFTGNGLRNEDYYCFGDTLYAPGEGQIVEMENLVPENIPRQVNKNQLFGNYVIIDHGNDEFSVLAHFMKNSITVTGGDMVTKGQVIGLVGNSGNSTEPHLHYHLQNKPSIMHGEGLPAQFRNYFANGVFVSVGEPLKNQEIRKDW